MEEKKPIILVGGGTGGHIMPLVAIGEELAAQNIPFIYVGTENSKEQEIVEKLGWSFSVIEAGKMRRYATASSLLRNLTDLFRTASGFFQSISFLLKTGAPVIVSKGGYVAVPMVYAARVLGRRVYIHESDTVMGLANRLSEKFARKVFTAFAPNVYPKADQRYVQVGIPIRRSLRQAALLKTPRKSRHLILCMGGIQGASAINAFIRRNISQLTKQADIIHVTGEREIAQHVEFKQSLASAEQEAYKPFGYLDRELAYYFQAADLLISRASATTIAEAALFGKAVFLIPLPTAAGNHQVLNAKALENQGSAIVREEYQLSDEGFISIVTELMQNSSKREALGQSLRSYFFKEDSIDVIIREIKQ